MTLRRPVGSERGVPRGVISRRQLLAASGLIVVGGLSGCLNQVASRVTNTGSSPAAVFAGVDWNDDDTEVTFTFEDELLGEPHVARLTPTLGERVELEGWVTSSAVMAQDYNSSRSNKPRSRAADEDSDLPDLGDRDYNDALFLAHPGGEPLTEAERAELVEYLSGAPVVGERFTVCLPDAEVPGGNGSIREAVTPERLFAYLTGQSDGEGNVYAWGKNPRGLSGPDEGGDCDDNDSTVSPGAVCGTTPHFVAEMTGPVATSGGLVAERTVDGRVVVANTPPTAGDGPSMMVCPVEGEPFVPEGLDAWGKRAGGGPPATMEAPGRLSSATVVQVLVQPPQCPVPFPALLYVSRGLSDGQLVYSGGWIIDDAALYGDSVTVLSMAGATEVVPVGLDVIGDVDGDGVGDVVARAGLSERARRGARFESGVVGGEGGITIEGLGGRLPSIVSGNGGEEGEAYGSVTHVAVDAPVLHLVNAASVSNEVKFKTGAELSKSAN